MALHLVEMVLKFLFGVSQLVDAHLEGEVCAAALAVDVVARRLKDAVGDRAQAYRVAALFLGVRQVALREVRPFVHRRRPAQRSCPVLDPPTHA